MNEVPYRSVECKTQRDSVRANGGSLHYTKPLHKAAQGERI
ncbi:MAG: hypothetical protein WC058_02390 [Phycisphaeraceae bacterium]